MYMILRIGPFVAAEWNYGYAYNCSGFSHKILFPETLKIHFSLLYLLIFYY